MADILHRVGIKSSYLINYSGAVIPISAHSSLDGP